jgi:FMN phosphatase YigB (HAD superfamily)
MGIAAILFDANGVLYERPPVGVALANLLEQNDLKPRHPKVIENILRAATYDVNVGRLPLQDYYTALLRAHGLTTEAGLAAGREALRFDATRVEIPYGTETALARLFNGGLRLGGVVNSPYKAADEVSWLARTGIKAEWWTVYVSSVEIGAIFPDPISINAIFQAFNCPPNEAVFVSQNEGLLQYALEIGMVAAAFNPPRLVEGVHASLESLAQLVNLVNV